MVLLSTESSLCVILKFVTKLKRLNDRTDYMWFSFLKMFEGAALVEWLSSWLAEQEVRGSIPGFVT